MVAPDGSQVGVKSIQEAMWLADQLGLDLVEVAPTAKPPVARLMDYGKYKYEQSVKDREARKKQTRSTIKEITFRVKIGDHDFKIKSDRAKKFLHHGDKVRARIWFRGREASRPQLGLTILERLTEDLVGVGKVDQEAKQEGRNMTMTLSPLPKREQQAAAEEAAVPVGEVVAPAADTLEKTTEAEVKPGEEAAESEAGDQVIGETDDPADS